MSDHRVRRLVGLLLVAPAAVALLVGYGWPTIWTVAASFHEVTFPGRHFDGFLGLDNFQVLLRQRDDTDLSLDEGMTALLEAAGIAFLPLVALLGVAPLLAWAADRAGRPARLGIRVVLAVPMACLVPVGLAAGWLLDRPLPVTSGASGVVGLSTFGMACGLGVTLYLAARRDRRAATVVVVAGLAAVAVLAVSLQAFTHPAIHDQPCVHNTLMLDLYQGGCYGYEDRGWVGGSTPDGEAVAPDLGVSAARAVAVLVPLMMLGIAAAVMVIVTGLRVELHPTSPSPTSGGRRRLTAGVLAAVMLAGVLAVSVYGMWPWLSRLGDFGPLGAPAAGPAPAPAWLPPLVSTVVGVGLAAVAGFGIGGLRPLGRWSELLLLPFAPWLFVSIGPLFVARYEPNQRAGTLFGMVPPVLLVVPALFLFTLLFRGLARRPVGYRRTIMPALPMLALAGGATWLLQSQSLLWGLLVTGFGPRGHDDEGMLATFVGEGAALDLVPPAGVVLAFAVALGVLQPYYLDRLAIRTGPVVPERSPGWQ
jgi:hypothetical protein